MKCILKQTKKITKRKMHFKINSQTNEGTVQDGTQTHNLSLRRQAPYPLGHPKSYAPKHKSVFQLFWWLKLFVCNFEFRHSAHHWILDFGSALTTTESIAY